MKVVDMHCDTIMAIWLDPSKELYRNDLMLDIEKMQKGDYLLQNFAMFVNLKGADDGYDQCHEMIDCYYKELEKNKDYIAPVYCYDDIEKNIKDGKMSAMLTIEEGAVVHHDIKELQKYYDLGVRMITLTWNYDTYIGHPNRTNDTGYHCYNDAGLTDFGIEYVKEMERLGIIIDVSHLSDGGFRDVLKYTTKPFVASHSDARAVTDNCRNLTDDMIRELSKRGGVTGLNYCVNFLQECDSWKDLSKIEDMVKHAKHIKDIGGIDCLGLGSDFDGIYPNCELRDGSYMPLLADALLENGFTQEEVEKIFYKNVLRLYKEILK